MSRRRASELAQTLAAPPAHALADTRRQAHAHARAHAQTHSYIHDSGCGRTTYAWALESTEATVVLVSQRVAALPLLCFHLPLSFLLP